MKGLNYKNKVILLMLVVSLFYQMFSVRGDDRSLFIKLDTLIWMLLYNDLFKNATFLLLMYQCYLKYNTLAMTISDNLIMTMICVYTILIVNYYQQFLLWMEILAFYHTKIMMVGVI